MPQPAQQLQRLLALLGIEHLAAAKPQPQTALAGEPINPGGQLQIQPVLTADPEEIDGQHQQRQSRAPQPAERRMAATELANRPAQLIAVLGGQLLAGEAEGRRGPIINGQSGIEPAVIPHQADHGVWRQLPHLQLLRSHGALRQEPQILSRSPGQQLRCLGAGGRPNLDHPPALQAHPRRHRRCLFQRSGPCRQSWQTLRLAWRGLGKKHSGGWLSSQWHEGRLSNRDLQSKGRRSSTRKAGAEGHPKGSQDDDQSESGRPEEQESRPPSPEQNHPGAHHPRWVDRGGGLQLASTRLQNGLTVRLPACRSEEQPITSARGMALLAGAHQRPRMI